MCYINIDCVLLRKPPQEQSGAVTKELQIVLHEFKKYVQTPSGVKAFFENCSEVHTFMDGELAFDMLNDDKHYVYRFVAPKRIELVTEQGTVLSDFKEDNYFRQFLIMLSEAIDVYEKKEKVEG